MRRMVMCVYVVILVGLGSCEEVREIDRYMDEIKFDITSHKKKMVEYMSRDKCDGLKQKVGRLKSEEE